MPSIVVPEGFSYVLATIAATGLLNVWQVSKVGAARKKAGIDHPQLYAEKAQVDASKDAYVYNCVQRAHQNTLESIPYVMSSLVLTGLKWPYVASGLGSAFILGRVMYTIGYSSGDHKKRGKSGGILGLLAPLALILSSVYVAYELVCAESGI